MSERLDEIKDKFMEYEHDFNLKKEDIKWLIKQAERVEELKEEVEKQKNRKYLKMRQRDDFMKKAQRYKQALEEILKPLNQTSYEKERTYRQIAREALEGEK